MLLCKDSTQVLEHSLFKDTLQDISSNVLFKRSQVPAPVVWKSSAKICVCVHIYIYMYIYCYHY